MPLSPRLLRPLAKLAEGVSLWYASVFPEYWHWSE